VVVLRQGQALRVSYKISTHSGSILLENLAFKTPNPERMTFFFSLFSFEDNFEFEPKPLPRFYNFDSSFSTTFQLRFGDNAYIFHLYK